VATTEVHPLWQLGYVPWGAKDYGGTCCVSCQVIECYASIVHAAFLVLLVRGLTTETD